MCRSDISWLYMCLKEFYTLECVSITSVFWALHFWMIRSVQLVVNAILISTAFLVAREKCCANEARLLFVFSRASSYRDPTKLTNRIAWEKVVSVINIFSYCVCKNNPYSLLTGLCIWMLQKIMTRKALTRGNPMNSDNLEGKEKGLGETIRPR